MEMAAPTLTNPHTQDEGIECNDLWEKTEVTVMERILVPALPQPLFFPCWTSLSLFQSATVRESRTASRGSALLWDNASPVGTFTPPGSHLLRAPYNFTISLGPSLWAHPQSPVIVVVCSTSSTCLWDLADRAAIRSNVDGKMWVSWSLALSFPLFPCQEKWRGTGEVEHTLSECKTAWGISWLLTEWV